MTRKEYISEQITNDMARNVSKMEKIVQELKTAISSEAEIETKIMRFQEAINNLNNGCNVSFLTAYFDYSKALETK